jgi:hypothetical protein
VTKPPNYLDEFLRQALEAKAKHGNGLYIATIAHGDWCDQLAGRGPCNCEPVVTTERWKDPEA